MTTSSVMAMLATAPVNSSLARLRAPVAELCAGLARDLSGEGIGPAIRSGLLAAEAVEAHLRRGASLESYGTEIVRRYGSGEAGWLGRQLAKLPDACARILVRAALRTGAMRRHVVLGRIFGMREAAS